MAAPQTMAHWEKSSFSNLRACCSVDGGMAERAGNSTSPMFEISYAHSRFLLIAEVW